MGRGRKRKPFFPIPSEDGNVLKYGPQCAKCGEVKPLDDFVVAASGSIGYCKSCSNTLAKERYKNKQVERAKRAELAQYIEKYFPEEVEEEKEYARCVQYGEEYLREEEMLFMKRLMELRKKIGLE